MPPMTRHVPAPFRKGLERDLSRIQQGWETAWVMQDAAWPVGVTSKRGPLRRAGSASLTGDPADQILGVMVWERPSGARDLVVSFLDVSAGIYYVATLADGNYDYADTATITASSVAVLPNAAVPLCVYNGEVILGHLSHPTKPLIRYAGVGAGSTSLTGTPAIYSGQDVVSAGSGTNFLSACAPGRYFTISSTAMGRLSLLIEYVQSDTIARVAGKVDQDIASGAWSVSGTGTVNLHALVTDRGTMQQGGSSVAITGRGTDWVNGARALAAGDSFGRVNDYRTVSSVGSNSSITLADSPAGVWTNGTYLATRPMFGSLACVHGGRLFVSGDANDNDRISVFPPEYQMSGMLNGVDSPTNLALRARLAEKMNLGGVGSPGKMVALLSGGDSGPLVALKSDDAYLIYGEWPDINVVQLGLQYGCCQSSWPGGAAVASPEGVYWAGAHNIWRYRSGAPEPMLEGRLSTEWRSITSSAAFTSARVTAVAGHLFVDTDASDTYVCDLSTGAWSTWTNAGFKFAAVDGDTPGRREAYVVTDANAICGLSSTVDGATYAGTSPGTFIVESGDSGFDRIDGMFRVLEARITYELYPATARVDVGFGDSTFTTAATLVGTAKGAAPTVQTTIIPKRSPGLGGKVRRWRVRLAETTAADEFVIHSISYRIRRFAERS